MTVISQFCLSCFHKMDLPASAAGTIVRCEACKATVTVPNLYKPTVKDPRTVMSEAVPNPPSVPPTPPGLVIPPSPAAPSATSPTSPVADTHTSNGTASTGTDASANQLTSQCGVSLPTKLIEWLPSACFSLILVLTVFSWVGLFPGGYKAYSQSPWGALTGTFTTDHFSEEVIKLESSIKKTIGSNFALLALYFLGLFFVLALAWADRFITMAHITTLPNNMKFIEKVWPLRFTIITGLAVALFLVLITQLWIGFGLENAVNAIVNEQFAERLADAQGSSAALQKINVEAGMKLGAYQIQTTTALAFVVILHLLAIVGAAGRFWLNGRKNKPAPRLVLNW